MDFVLTTRRPNILLTSWRCQVEYAKRFSLILIAAACVYIVYKTTNGIRHHQPGFSIRGDVGVGISRGISTTRDTMDLHVTSKYQLRTSPDTELLWNKDRDRIMAEHSTNVASQTKAQSIDSTTVNYKSTAPISEYVTLVKTNGTYFDRIAIYNNVLDERRSYLLASCRLLNTTWTGFRSSAFRTVYVGPNKTTTDLLARYNISTILLQLAEWEYNPSLPHVLRSESNLLVRRYYEWTATAPLCQWLRTPGGTKKMYNITTRFCEDEMSKAADPKPLELPYLKLHSLPFTEHMFYIHIIPHGVVEKNGEVFSEGISLNHMFCRDLNMLEHPTKEYANAPLYDEVFLISHLWGEYYFHKHVEDLPRLVPYLDFLKKHPNIRIHAKETKGITANMVSVLGIDISRLVSGNLRAKIIYNPQGTRCGTANIHTTQLMSHLYREHIHHHYPEQVANRNSLVFMSRSHHRQLTDFEGKKKGLEQLAEEHGLDFVLYGDSSLPPFKEQMEIFNRALMVVGAHGAGFSNVIFSEPGTVVIEGVNNRPYIQLCYQWLAHILGHRYHAIVSRQGYPEVTDLNTTQLLSVARAYLKIVHIS